MIPALLATFCFNMEIIGVVLLLFFSFYQWIQWVLYFWWHSTFTCKASNTIFLTIWIVYKQQSLEVLVKCLQCVYVSCVFVYIQIYFMMRLVQNLHFKPTMLCGLSWGVLFSFFPKDILALPLLAGELHSTLY